jgi:hypothetical protein
MMQIPLKRLGGWAVVREIGWWPALVKKMLSRFPVLLFYFIERIPLLYKDLTWYIPLFKAKISNVPLSWMVLAISTGRSIRTSVLSLYLARLKTIWMILKAWGNFRSFLVFFMVFSHFLLHSTGIFSR